MSGWRQLAIRDLGRVVTGKTPPTGSAEYFEGGDELFVSPKDLSRSSYYVDKTETRITERALQKFKGQVIPRNTVMFTSLSFAFGKMGIAAQRCMTNQQINSVVVGAEHDFKFVYYLLRAYESIIFSFNSGIDTPIVPKSVFESIQVNVPADRVAEEKIAAILSAYDDLITNNQRRVALLESMAEEIYREWFVRMRFPGHESTRIEKGLPRGWREVALQTMANVNANSIKRRLAPEWIEYLDISAVTTNAMSQPELVRIDDAPGRARRIARHGDVIWSTVRPANRAYALVLHPAENLIVSTGFAVLSPKLETPYTYFHQAVTTNNFVEQMVTVAKGSAYPATGFDDFAKAKIIWPADALLRCFHDLVEPMALEAAALRKQCVQLSKLRDALLPRLISGKLKVDHLDIQLPPSMREKVTA
jgi:type I restriction enzyme, S subunit